MFWFVMFQFGNKLAVQGYCLTHFAVHICGHNNMPVQSAGNWNHRFHHKE